MLGVSVRYVRVTLAEDYRCVLGARPTLGEHRARIPTSMGEMGGGNSKSIL